jgi:DNA-binding MarR family transcriptional regulator
MSDLSRMLLVSNGNATAVVDRLEADGFVRRSPSETDRRTVFAALTPEGLAQFEVYAAEHEAEVNRIFGGLTEAELDQLSDLLKRMRGTK